MLSLPYWIAIYYFICRYPAFTSELVLQSFRGSVVRGKASERLNNFIQMTMKGDEGLDKIGVVKMDCLELTNIAEHVANFRGVGLVFIDIPKASSLKY